MQPLFRVYKADVIAKDANTDVAFNGNGEETDQPSFEKNYIWYKKQFTRNNATTELIMKNIDESEGKYVTEDENSENIKKKEENVTCKLENMKDCL